MAGDATGGIAEVTPPAARQVTSPTAAARMSDGAMPAPKVIAIRSRWATGHAAPAVRTRPTL
jgi:hypothetical protein